MKRTLAALVLCLLALVPVRAQEKAVPVGEEEHHHMVLENEYTRVFYVVVPPKQATLLHQHDRDYVYVMIGSADIRNARQDALAPVEQKLGDGEVKFAKGGFTHKVTALAETPFVNVTIEVKKPSTKSVCGANWVGAQPENPGACGMVASGNSGQADDLETDSVAATDWFTNRSVTPHDAEKPRLLVALSDFSCVCGGTGALKMKPGDVAWLPKGMFAAVSKTGKENPRFVVVSFK